MTFRHIVMRNLRYNAKRYLSYLFVNSFVVSVLFLYGSLLFNDVLAGNPATKTANLYIYVAAVAIVLFCAAFVAYTGIYFVKSRGREFGVYFTLGMNSRDLMKMVLLETSVIMFASVVCGLVAGLAFSSVFYMILAKILNLSMAIYQITLPIFGLTLGVFLVVMLFNMIFTGWFLRKLSILQVTKSQNTKGKSASRPVLGIAGLVSFAFSLWFFHGLLNGYTFLRDISRDYGHILLIGTMILMMASLYLTIAFFISGLLRIIKGFPKIYNRYILAFSDLSHKFFSYKTSLYIISGLIAFSLFFVGFGIGSFSSDITKNKVAEAFPYDFMIENVGDINRISENEIKNIVTENGGEIAEFYALPYITDVNYRNLPEFFLTYRVDSMLISESTFSNLTGDKLNLSENEMALVYADRKSSTRPMDFDSVITIEPWRDGIVRGDAFRAAPTDMNTFIKSLDVSYLTYTQENTRVLYIPFMNKYGDFEFKGAVANVVNDTVYESVEQSAGINTLYLFNLKSGDGAVIYDALLDTLRQTNGKPNLWQSGTAGFGEKDNPEHLRPIYKAERQDTAEKVSGFLLFSMMFLGLLFLLSSSIVLYYKIAADENEEKDKFTLLQKVGLTVREYRKDLSMRLNILFFAPLVFGGVLGLLLVVEVVSVSMAVYAGYLMTRVLIVYGLLCLWNMIICFLLKRKLLKSVVK